MLCIAQITTQAINTDSSKGVETMHMMQQTQNEASTSTTHCSSNLVKRQLPPNVLIGSNQTGNHDVVCHSEIVETSQDENIEENEACDSSFDSSFVITPDYIQQSN